MAEIKGSKIKFYTSKTASEAATLAATEPGSVFFTDDGIILNGKYYGQPNPDASEIVEGLGDTYVKNATFATNASKLNNVAASNYARTDVEEEFKSDVTISSNLQVLTDTTLGGNLHVDGYTILSSDSYIGTADDANQLVTRGDIANIAGAMHFKGVADTTGDTKFSDGLATTSVKVGGNTFTAVAGDFVIQGGLEYVFSGTKWTLLGDESKYVLKTQAYSVNDTDAGIKVALGGTANSPTIDVAVTEGSVASGNTSLVKGGTVYTAISNAINALDFNTTGTANGAQNTVNIIKQDNGKLSVSFQEINILPKQVSGLTDALAEKQNKLSTDQLNAVNSGITSTKVSTYDGYAATISNKANTSDLNAAKNRISNLEAKTSTIDQHNTSLAIFNTPPGDNVQTSNLILNERFAIIGGADGDPAFYVGTISNGIYGAVLDSGTLYVGGYNNTGTEITNSAIKVKGFNIVEALTWQ